MGNQNTQDGQWKLSVLLLREKAIQKLGTGWQTALAENTNFSQGNISRMFGLKYAPSLKNFTILAEALELDISLIDKGNLSDNE